MVRNCAHSGCVLTICRLFFFYFRWQIKLVSLLFILYASTEMLRDPCDSCMHTNLSPLSVWTDYVEGGCPVKLLGSVSESLDDQFYSECVTVSVWMKRDGMESNHSSKIHFVITREAVICQMYVTLLLFQTYQRTRRLKLSPKPLKQLYLP